MVDYLAAAQVAVNEAGAGWLILKVVISLQNAGWQAGCLERVAGLLEVV